MSVILRAVCSYCRRPVAVTTDGRIWTHGPVGDRCRGSRERTRRGSVPIRVWPTRHRGRRVVTVPGPDTWNPITLERTTT
ncbi:hypothetical protein [Streptomyces xanthochromogenes]